MTVILDLVVLGAVIGGWTFAPRWAHLTNKFTRPRPPGFVYLDERTTVVVFRAAFVLIGIVWAISVVRQLGGW